MSRLTATPVLLATLVLCAVATVALGAHVTLDLRQAGTATGAVTRTSARTSVVRVRLSRTGGDQRRLTIVAQTHVPAAAVEAAVEVHNTPRTVIGGRSTPCAVHPTPHAPQPGCEIISSITAPGALVTYRIVYPGVRGLVQTFVDKADARGHSLRVANVPYQGPAGARHGSPTTVARLVVTARLPDGTVSVPGSTRFTVMR